MKTYQQKRSTSTTPKLLPELQRGSILSEILIRYFRRRKTGTINAEHVRESTIKLRPAPADFQKDDPIPMTRSDAS